MNLKKNTINSIKKLEKKVIKDPKDHGALKTLLDEFKKLIKLDYGPLTYVDITPAEQIKELYKTDTELYFEDLDRKSADLKRASNPSNYAWLQADIQLVVIENTPKNEKLAERIIKQIISAIRKRLA